jgi:hypothetical protein
MDKRKILGFIIFDILFLAIILGFLYYSGFFSPVNIKEEVKGPHKLVYEEHTGPYRGIKEVNEKVFKSLRDDKIHTHRGFGIYYDNPKEVPEAELKSIGGCIVEIKDYSRIEELKDRYNTKNHPEKHSIVVEFPFTTPLSIMAGIMKVYPELENYLKSNGYKQAPVMEIYDIPAKKIEYIIPVVKEIDENL